MKKVLILFFSVWSILSFGQTNYEKGMKKAMNEWHKGNTKEALAVLERISDAKPADWIPVYYQVLINITQGFQNPRSETVASIVEQNRMLIERWLDKKDDEWYVLQGMNETLDLMTDPMNKGMSQSPIIIAAYQKAIKLDSDNPRAVYSLANFYLNSSKFMKIDEEQCIKDLRRSIELFDQQKEQEPFYPSWGREWALKTLTVYEKK
ncbi:tetratricopeptide repeat protein [Myroides sp. WP-1]|uniref:tetratricopeptide repeat protein n=1 Tax=Myroides sp. WP-1 TaxID=2759944 RepID=UPI0015FE53DE|nr:tetratricopeptide repeat protein [Myroides sp. WP-1]MBB1138641.1 hypothetical protein [Myroides sp. WP-1]